MKQNKEKQENSINLIKEKLKILNHDEEDEELILKLVYTYYRKRKITGSSNPIMAASFLWLYSKINFMWEGDKDWMKMNIAVLFQVSPDTIGNKASNLSKALKIQLFDNRFCKACIAEHDPFKKFVMLSNGIIIPRDISLESFSNSNALKKETETPSKIESSNNEQTNLNNFFDIGK